MFNKIKAISKAKELLNKYDITEPIVNVLDILEAEKLKISFVPMPDNNISGFFDSTTNTIVVNKNDSTERKNFTIAHELGHFILGHKPGTYGILYRKSLGDKEKSSLEKEADCFAANLLVPEFMLKNIITKKISYKDSDSWIIAKLFGVSEQVIKFRLRHISTQPWIQ